MLSDETRQAAIIALDEMRVNAISDYVNKIIPLNEINHIVAQIDSALAELRQPATPDAWEVVPLSLEYDLITHAMKHGEIPQGYRICKKAGG